MWVDRGAFVANGVCEHMRATLLHSKAMLLLQPGERPKYPLSAPVAAMWGAAGSGREGGQLLLPD